MTTAPRWLWLSAELPDEPRTGLHQYSRGLREGVSAAGVAVEAMGIGPASGCEAAGVRRRPIGGVMRPWQGSLLSPLPNLAYAPAGDRYRNAVAAALTGEVWDAVVIDHLQMGWVVREIERSRYRVGLRQNGPALVAVSHNHESTVRRSVAASYPCWSPRGVVLRLDSRKACALEADVVRRADLLTCITEADVDAFAASHAPASAVVISPGYVDPRAVPIPAAARPRRVVMVGSFDWHVKTANLRGFLTAADPVLAAAGIRLSVVGRTPPGFTNGFGHTLRATEFLGWVDDLRPVLESSRLAIVAESSGGGFKMKTLDYVFHHVPVAHTQGSVEGIGLRTGIESFEAADDAALASLIVAVIDGTERLDAVAAAAYRHAAERFSWSRAGRTMVDAVSRISGAFRAG